MSSTRIICSAILFATLACCLIISAQANECETSNPCKIHKCSYGALCVVKSGKPFCECPSVCLAIYDPVCGTNGVTYSNSCQLNSAACRLKRVIKLDHKGECGKDNNES